MALKNIYLHDIPVDLFIKYFNQTNSAYQENELETKNITANYTGMYFQFKEMSDSGEVAISCEADKINPYYMNNDSLLEFIGSFSNKAAYLENSNRKTF